MKITDLFKSEELTENNAGYKTVCPDCGLQGGRTEGFQIFPESNSWFCHSTGKHGGILELIAIKNKIIKCIDCNDTGEKEKVLEDEMLKETLDCIEEEYGKDFLNDVLDLLGFRDAIQIPGNNRLISNFANDVVKKISPKNILFYRSELRDVVEIGKIKTADGKSVDSGFISLSTHRFITLVERYFKPWSEIYTKKGTMQVPKSLNSAAAKPVIVSDNFIDKLPVINRIFLVQQPIIDGEGKLTFPKEGYDARFGSWLSSNAPKIDNPNMSLEESKKILNTIYSEFCFKEEQSRTNSIAGLLTPYLRGLYSSFNVRTPIMGYLANQSRAGKDYDAGITGIVFEGEAVEESPISTGDKSGSTNQELRKKITAIVISGRKRFHSSNNKQLLNNAVLESISTATRFSDRLLGKNDMVTFDNEMEFSFSGNIGMSLTPDLSNRTIFVNLFFAKENTNERKFKNPNLHEWVKNNREIVLSALYALVRNWFDKGCPKGSVPFASFPEWAEVCGGIMEAADLGNPCIKSEEGYSVSLDPETEDMKCLFEICYEKKPNKTLTKKDIKEIVLDSEENLFGYVDWDKKSDQIKFGKKVDRFVGRVLSDIRMRVFDDSVRSSRKEYIFDKEKPEIITKMPKSSHNVMNLGQDGNVGNVEPIPKYPIGKGILRVGQTLPTLPKKPKIPTDLIPNKHIKGTPIPKTNREVQFWESKECQNIKSNCSKKEVQEYLKLNPKATNEELYKKFGDGVFVIKKEIEKEQKK